MTAAAVDRLVHHATIIEMNGESYRKRFALRRAEKDGNPIESVFATVRHRTVRTKGSLSAKTAKLMVFKLVNAAAKTWRRLKGENQLPKVVQGIKFQNGIEVIEMPAHHAA
jgi:putative transposase